MKIIKNKKAYKNQALIELRILEFLNNEVDKQDLHHIIRLFDHFCYKDHLCIIFELLNENLYELLKQNYFQGISLNSIRFIIKQILEAVYQLQRANLIHCDLKPENILLKIDKDNNRNDVIIKITDFGSACFKNHTMFQYIQSRYYRAPEVLIGGRYGPEIDMWSIGCIAVELFLGEPILPGSSEFDQLGKIIKLTGNPPQYILKEGKNSRKYFTYDSQTKRCRIKTLEEYLKEFPNEAEHKYEIPLDLKNLDELLIKSNKKNLNVNHNLNISSNSLNTSNTNTNFDNSLDSFVNFLKGLLNVNPKLRWNAKQALRHPFITKEKFDGYFNPNAEEISQFLHQSIEASQHSNKTNYYTRKYPNSNSNVYHSIMVCNNNPYMSNNISYNNSISFTNSSLETSCYQLNTNKIPLHIIKNFPYAKIDEINLKPGKQKRKHHHNKYDNNTFMKTSYDEINFNNSFTSDHNFYSQKNREIKDDMMTKNKNKFSNFLRTGLIKNKSFGHSNQSNHNIKNNYNRNSGIPKGFNILQINEMHGGPAHIINEGTDKISSTDLSNFLKLNLLYSL
jgi:dual specificity protein kinase YAK1